MSEKEYPDINYLKRLANKAGKIIVRNFGKVGKELKRELKEDNTPVTIIDKDINNLVTKSISNDFPEISIIAEEGNCEITDARYRVFCDPLDGTFPFCMGLSIQTFCISILEENTPLIGLIYDPFHKRAWYAIRGKGSFLNEGRIKVSQNNRISGSQFSLIWWKDAHYNIGKVNDKIFDVGGVSINLMSIAIFGGLIGQGLVDGSIFPSKKGWETAAMQVIVEEAGGKVTDIHGKEMTYDPKGEINGHIISNGLIHNELVEIVASCQ